MAVAPVTPARVPASSRPSSLVSGAPSRGAGPHRRLGVVAIVVSATAMGAAGVFGRLASPPGALIGEALTLGRMLFGALGMLVILAFGGRLHLLRRTRVSWSVAVGGTALGLSLATLLSATVLIDLSLAVSLHYLGPVVAVVLARVLLKESASPATLGALVLSFLGMMLVAGLVGEPPAPVSAGRSTGIVLGVASGLLYGVALLSYRYRPDLPSDVRSFWNFVFGAGATGAVVAVTRPDLSGMTTTHWTWAFVFFAVCGLLALGLLVVAGKHLRATELSGLSFWEVVVAMLLGAAVFGEPITVLAGAGAVLILVGAVLPLTPAGEDRVTDRVAGRPGNDERHHVDGRTSVEVAWSENASAA